LIFWKLVHEWTKIAPVITQKSDELLSYFFASNQIVNQLRGLPDDIKFYPVRSEDHRPRKPSEGNDPSTSTRSESALPKNFGF
jgi:hypothetical protein